VHKAPGRLFSSAAEFLLVACPLCVLVGLAALWCYRNGYILYYGDAQSHLNLSRSVIDSRTPGYDQLGTVWLPVLHLICLPFVGNTSLWSSGLAGTIPVASCFIAAGLFFYYAAREVYGGRIAAAVVLAGLALNPNVMYLATIPMTEIVFAAGLGAMLFSILRFRSTQCVGYLSLGIFASWFMSLTRYEGWFLIPFSALAFALFAKQHALRTFIVFGAAASLAPVYWFAHNWWETSNPLDFYNGPYSAMAIQGGKRYRGYHDWLVAAQYYAKAGELCAGWGLVILGCAGFVCAALKKTLAPVGFLLLIPAFYIWSIHSSGLPIHVPQLWPHSYYNTRYGIAMVFVAAFAMGAIPSLLPQRAKRYAWLLPVLAIAPWLAHSSHENWICWKESQVNSDSRREWTRDAAHFLAAQYARRSGILTMSGSGDMAGIFCRAGIPLSEVLHEGNGPEWLAATSRPDLYRPTLWALAQRGDLVAKALHRPGPPAYALTGEIQTKDDPVLEIFRRDTPK
jgi:hypothetical protein